MLRQTVVDMPQVGNRTKEYVRSAHDVGHVGFKLLIMEVTWAFFEREQSFNRTMTLTHDTLVYESELVNVTSQYKDPKL